MAPTITLSGDKYVIQYLLRCMHTNPEYSLDDIEWIMYNIHNNYTTMIREITKFYTFLSLINYNTFCGYFSQTYNIKLTKSVKERDNNEFIKLINAPKFEEVLNNTLLNKVEQRELLDILQLETYAANLTIKRMSINTSFNGDIEKLYMDSYNDLFNKMFSKKINFNRADFQEFILITEYNAKTRHSHAYTFRLLDILKQCVTGEFNYELSENNIKSVKSRFVLEMKMVSYMLNN
jgi:hypothetical protein